MPRAARRGLPVAGAGIGLTVRVMPAVLCFGDSNTWGYDAAATAIPPFPVRHPRGTRWTGVLAAALGPDWHVIEEGQNGRTTVHEDPLADAPRNGLAHLPVVLESHKPLHAVVLMLGTNDLKVMLHLPPQDIAAGAAALVRAVLRSDAGPHAKPPQVLLVCPPAVGDFSGLPDLAARFCQAREKSLQFPVHYAAVAKANGVAFLNAQDFVSPDPVDGLHLDAASHAALGKAIAEGLRKMG